MKKLAAYFIIAVLLIVGLSSYSFAFGGHMNGRGHRQIMPGPGYIMWGFIQKDFQENPLDLTEEQQERLAELQEEFISENDELRSDLWDKQAELHEKIYVGASTKVIEALKIQINKLQKHLLDLHTDHLIKMRDILTDEQLEKVKKFYPFGRINRGFDGRGFAGPGFGDPGMMGGWGW